MPRRILLLNTDLEIGGTPTVVRELATRLRDAGAHIEVVGLSPPGPLQDQLYARRIKCTALGARGVRDFPRTIRRLHRLMTQEHIDTVLSFLIHANTIAAATRPFFPSARYLQSIQTTQPNPRWHWRLQSLVHHAAEQIIVPSPSVATVAQERSNIPADKFVVIPNAIDPADYTGGTGVPPVKSETPTHIGFIGRLDPIKRIPDLIQALTHLPTHQLHIYGEGAERPAIESEITRLHLADRVTLHGRIPDPQTALQAIDLLVLPSDAEGFGLVLIEAMAARVPVIATNVPGIRDVIRPNQTGLLVPPRNPQALAAAIHELTTNPTLRYRLITTAHQDVQSRFTWPAVFPQYLKLLQL